MTRLLVAVTLVFVLAGCASLQRPTVSVQAPFNRQQANDMLLPGPNTVRGNAFMRQRGGGVVTCAGETVFLIPATAYAVERFSALYGPGVEQGSNTRGVNPIFSPDPPEYYTTVKTAKCDSQGNFVFEKVSDGVFFAVTSVKWQAGNIFQGGHLMNRLNAKGGETINVVMSSQ